MSNPLAKFFAGLWKGIKYPFTHVTAIAEIFDEVVKDGGVIVESIPQVKGLVVNLVGKIEALGPDAISAFAGDGLNVPSDLKTLSDFQGLFVYIKGTFLPGVEAVYNELKANQLTGSSDAPAPAAAGTQEAPAGITTAAVAAAAAPSPTVVVHA